MCIIEVRTLPNEERQTSLKRRKYFTSNTLYEFRPSSGVFILLCLSEKIQWNSLLIRFIMRFNTLRMFTRDQYIVL